MPGTQTAQDFLGLDDIRGRPDKTYTDSVLSPTNRGVDDFLANKEDWPAGAPFDEEGFDLSRF